jgi:hypothetical protein
MRAFDWGEYLRLASALEAQATDEASLRSAASRAYYAAYHKAIDTADAHGVRIAPVTGYGSHSNCWMAYKTVAAFVGVGADGDRLMVIRVAADYKLEPGADWSKKARTAIALATKITNQL